MDLPWKNHVDGDENGDFWKPQNADLRWFTCSCASPCYRYGSSMAVVMGKLLDSGGHRDDVDGDLWHPGGWFLATPTWKMMESIGMMMSNSGKMPNNGPTSYHQPDIWVRHFPSCNHYHQESRCSEVPSCHGWFWCDPQLPSGPSSHHPIINPTLIQWNCPIHSEK